MTTFTKLELAALHSIFVETPQYADGLAVQLAGASVAARENTGGGFFTTISVAADIPQIPGPRVLGHETYASVEGLNHGMGFVLFMKDGYLNLLEGYSVGYENTASSNLATVTFTISGLPKD
jgi:hypothetical protein